MTANSTRLLVYGELIEHILGGCTEPLSGQELQIRCARALAQDETLGLQEARARLDHNVWTTVLGDLVRKRLVIEQDGPGFAALMPGYTPLAAQVPGRWLYASYLLVYQARLSVVDLSTHPAYKILAGVLDANPIVASAELADRCLRALILAGEIPRPDLEVTR